MSASLVSAIDALVDCVVANSNKTLDRAASDELRRLDSEIHALCQRAGLSIPLARSAGDPHIHGFGHTRIPWLTTLHPFGWPRRGGTATFRVLYSHDWHQAMRELQATAERQASGRDRSEDNPCGADVPDGSPAGYVAWCEAHRQMLIDLLSQGPPMERRDWTRAQAYVRVAGQFGMKLNPSVALAAGSPIRDSLGWQDNDPVRAIDQLEKCAEWGRRQLQAQAVAGSGIPRAEESGDPRGGSPSEALCDRPLSDQENERPESTVGGTREDPALSDLEYDVLQALYCLKATAPEKRQTAEGIASKVGGAASAASCKVPIARLKRGGLVGTKEGRRGGCWLTADGVALIKRVRKL